MERRGGRKGTEGEAAYPQKISKVGAQGLYFMPNRFTTHDSLCYVAENQPDSCSGDSDATVDKRFSHTECGVRRV